MADDLHIRGDFLAALGRYAQDVSSASIGAAAVGVNTFTDTLRDEARKNPRWAHIADSIEAWDEGGRLTFGVRRGDLLGARNAEFGDADNPPASIIRTPKRARQAASDAMDQHLRDWGF